MRTVFAFIAVSLAGAALAAGSAKIKNSHADPKYGKPVEFSKVAGTKGTMALEISGGKLYALEDNGLSVYDISEPKSPRLLGSVGGMGNVRQLKVSGKTAFVTSRQCGLWSVDVSDPSSPKILSHFDTAEMATGLDVADGLCVCRQPRLRGPVRRRVGPVGNAACFVCRHAGVAVGIL